MRRSALAYLGALLLANLRQGFARPSTAWAAMVMMFANNVVFFVVWVFYFAQFRDLRGWQLDDMALLYGIAAWAFGFVIAFGAGVREIGRAILDGSLDVHLGRPRHPLPSLILSRSGPSGFGDMASALALWWFAGRGLGDMAFAAALSTGAAAIIVASLVIAHAAVFWWPRAGRLGEETLQAIIMIAVYPQHVYGMAVRVVLFTLLPVGFIALMPVEAVRDADPWKAAAVLAAAAVYGALAWRVFDRGLGRYRSGNLLVQNR